MPGVGTPERTPSEAAARDAVRTLLALFIALSVIIGAGAWALAHADIDLRFFGMGETHFGERRRLAPIAIPMSACPRLSTVRESSSELTDFWMRNLYGKTDWAQARVELAPKLAEFELAAVVAKQDVPPRVAAELEKVAKQVEMGRAQLLNSRDAWDYVSESGFFDGWNALSDASDLVGTACGAPLLGDGVRPLKSVSILDDSHR